MSFQLKEVTGNLFSASSEYSLAHCVSADLKMGKGIAIEFRNKFGQQECLRNQKVRPGGVAVLKDGQRFVYNLITKEFSYQLPTYERMFAALYAMREHMVNNGVKKLAIPMLGCGLDKMDWSKVKEQITEIFCKDPIEIVVYKFIRK